MSVVPENARRVVVEVERDLVHSKSAKKQFGSWSKRWDCSVSAVRLTDETPDEENDAFLVGPGKEVHVLILRYSDGDSYGRESGMLDVIHAFADAALADRAKEIFATAEKFEPMTFEDDFGRAITMPACSTSNSYFESHQDIEVVTMEITS